MIKAIIIDDERGAYINLNELLSTYCKQVEVIGYASNTQEAESIIQSSKPDLVFIDINMPQESGIEFIKRIWPISFEIIFVTAYDEYALKVFKLNALDYILKPISISYLKESIERATEMIQSKKASQAIEADERFISNIPTTSSVVLRDGNAQKRFSFEDITHLHAAGSYTTFYIQTSKAITCGYNLAHYEDIIPTNTFVRTHKSYIVNIHKIGSIVTHEGSPHCKLINNELIPISRRRLTDIKKMLNEM